MAIKSTKQFSDLPIPAETIQRFSEIDLGRLNNLPSEPAELVALSMHMDAAFHNWCALVFRQIAEDHEEIGPSVMETVIGELALNFIERYGALAFFSTDIVKILWDAQRPKRSKGPELLRKVGQKLAIFSLAGRGSRPKKTIDISFKLCKPDFLAELERLSRELGRSASKEPWDVQLLGSVRMGEYPMLKLNLTLLDEFFQCQATNPDLSAKNATSAELLAEYGIGKELGERREPSMTPDWFFYTWIAWISNKRRSTVRKEIQTAETRFKAAINKRIRVTNNR